MYRPATPSAVRAYANVGLETGVAAADPHGLVLMLYDGVIRCALRARQAMQAGDAAARGAAVTKALQILDEGLCVSLDERSGGEIAARLSLLYRYIAMRLLAANVRNDEAALEEALRLLRVLRDAWAEIAPGARPAPAPEPVRGPLPRLAAMAA